MNEFRERFPIAFYAETETDYVLDFCVAEEPERIIHEFDNYVIGLENRVGMQT